MSVDNDSGGGYEKAGDPSVANIPLRWMLREICSLPHKPILDPSELYRSGVYPELPPNADLQTVYDVIKLAADADGAGPDDRAVAKDGNPYTEKTKQDLIGAKVHNSLTWKWWPVEWFWFWRRGDGQGSQSRTFW